jgi:hypothetical protein
MGLTMKATILVRRYNSDDESFRRQLTFAEEDRRLFTTAPWSGGYRWFRAPNVTPIEHWRRISSLATTTKHAGTTNIA